MQEPKPNVALIGKLQRLQTKVNDQHRTIRGQKQRIADLNQSRALWKAKYKALQKAPDRPRPRQPKATRPAGYQYSLATIKLSEWLYVLGGCSYRYVVQVLLYLQTEWTLPIDVPAKSSIVGWVEKVGCYRYEHPPAPTPPTLRPVGG